MIGSTNQQPATPQHDNITVDPHLLTRYGMEAHFAIHMPSYCSVGENRQRATPKQRHDLTSTVSPIPTASPVSAPPHFSNSF
ncbi:hypothetical protein TNCV_2873941 [Trichonephila clavipes]|nr:hypothetical protein TNCV_2873941 [Trichonephila clavipes]